MLERGRCREGSYGQEIFPLFPAIDRLGAFLLSHVPLLLAIISCHLLLEIDKGTRPDQRELLLLVLHAAALPSDPSVYSGWLNSVDPAGARAITAVGVVFPVIDRGSRRLQRALIELGFECKSQRGRQLS